MQGAAGGTEAHRCSGVGGAEYKPAPELVRGATSLHARSHSHSHATSPTDTPRHPAACTNGVIAAVKRGRTQPGMQRAPIFEEKIGAR